MLEARTFFDVALAHLRQASEVVQLSWAFCENCLSVRAFQRGRVFSQHDNSADSMGTPCLLRGASRSGGLFWVLFWAVAKEYLARGAKTAMSNQFKVVNVILPSPTKPKSRNEVPLLQIRENHTPSILLLYTKLRV